MHMSLFEGKSLTISYRQDTACHPLITDASFSLEASKIYDLVGRSGSGKSTLLRACALMLGIDAGEFLLDGVPSSRLSFQQWRRNVCLVPQKTALCPGTIEENLLLPWTLKINAGETPPTRDKLIDLLAEAGLDGVRLSDDISRLSGGQTARIALLRAFASQPRVLLLDEVDAALDDVSSSMISELTAHVVTPRTTCLRIRHRVSDGLSAGVFTLEKGRLSYEGH